MALHVLHTSDWHLGRHLYGQNRYEEFEQLLDWMVATLKQQNIDVLLIAGDVFDTGTPSNRAQHQYYRFLTRVADTGCRHVVIIGGNHDSPSFLNAPATLLKVLNVHIVGAMTDNAADEVLVLSGTDGVPEMIVCAVPYLRDRDIRSVEAGESIEDKEQKLLSGIRNHYAEVCEHARQIHTQLDPSLQLQVPVVGMGHLFTAGGRTTEDDGVRDLYVGSLAHVGSDIFPAMLDYVALGHLHVPQAVGGNEHIRYSGSPLPMGFGEATQQKSVCIVQFEQQQPRLELLPVPCFQRLRQLRGNLQALVSDLAHIASEGTETWVEILYTGEDVVPDLREQLENAADNSNGMVTILRIRHSRQTTNILSADMPGQTLDDLSPIDVFQRCLSAREIPDSQQVDLLHAYQEILHQLETDEA
jgi:DNA repair protein SbcD/Mre11